jgi:hypothetical protein
MIHIPNLILVEAGAILVLKMLLILEWTRRLFAIHKDRYRFSELFQMMFAPQSPSSVDPSLWKDLRGIQNWNRGTSFAMVFLAFAIVLACLAMNRHGVTLNLPSFLLVSPKG